MKNEIIKAKHVNLIQEKLCWVNPSKKENLRQKTFQIMLGKVLKIFTKIISADIKADVKQTIKQLVAVSHNIL